MDVRCVSVGRMVVDVRYVSECGDDGGMDIRCVGRMCEG